MAPQPPFTIPADYHTHLPHEFLEHEKQYMQRLFNYVRFLPIEAHRYQADGVYDNSLTMVPKQGVFACLLGLRHLLNNDIPGDIVECGVWRGGMSILMAGMLKLYNSDRKLYLFDTFSGMTEPAAQDGFKGNEKRINDFVTSKSSLEEVRANFEKVGLLSDNIVFVQGDVCKTLENPANIPEKIALLRLDTDMYASTKAELEALYPKLVSGGILIIDDYGDTGWIGSGIATDEYFAKNKRPFLTSINTWDRIGVRI